MEILTSHSNEMEIGKRGSHSFIPVRTIDPCRGGSENELLEGFSLKKY